MAKKRKVILCSVLIMSLLIGSCSLYSWYYPNVHIKNFDGLQSHYERIVNVVTIFYNEQVEKKDLTFIINIPEYTLSYGDIDIILSVEEQESLKIICKSAYRVEYSYIRVTSFDVSFWVGEMVEYAIFYTTNLYETYKTVKKYASDDPKLKRINKNWYELSSYHL